MRTSQDWLFATVEYDLSQKNMVIQWRYRTGDGQAHFSFQTEALAFWPTEVASYGEDRILVAGRDELTGDTVIEEWLFDTSSLSTSAVAPYLSVPVKSKTSAFRSSTFDTVRVMFKVQGVSGKVFIQFWTDRDLYVMQPPTREVTKVLSVAPDGTIPVLPELQATSLARFSRHHEVEGYVYYLGDTEAEEGLFLMDHDLDGELDEYGPLDTDTFYARQLDQGDLVVEFY